MATTALTTTPMVPVGGEGSTIAASMQRCELGGTVAVGDVLVIDGGAGAVEDNSGPVVAIGSTPVGIMGVAMEAGVDGGFINYAAAFPGRMFEANIVNNVTDTAIPTTSVLLQDTHGIIASADGFACLNSNSAIEVTMPMGWGRQTQPPFPGRQWDEFPGVTNPRVLFVFASSVFILSA